MSRLPKRRLPVPKLNSRNRTEHPFRTAVLGIGNELRGDDAVGIVIARALQPLAASRDRLLVIDAGAVPENCTGLLRRFKPDYVLIIDAAWMDIAPGSVRWVAWQDTAGFTASTHSLPLHVLAGYLAAELGCEVAILGIQPADTTLGAPLSPIVQQSVDTVLRTLVDMLQ
jgi:hydrogenase 3 maturation protease